MIQPDQLKPFLLDEDPDVRKEVVNYFSDAWSEDPEILPLILKACDMYGEDTNIRGLVRGNRFHLDQEAIANILERLPISDNYRVQYHLNNILARMPISLFTANETQLSQTANVTPDTRRRLKRRRKLSEKCDEDLWKELKGISEKSRYKKYVGEIDHTYVDDVIEALASSKIPDEETICDLLVSPEVENEWLEIFLIDLAGARKVRESVPILVDKATIDTDYMLDRTNEALARIGDPLAVRLVGEMFKDQDWNFKNYTTTLLARIKSEESEETICRLLQTESSPDIRAKLCEGLCDLFSKRGIDIVRQEILGGYDRWIACLEELLLVVAKVHGVSLPEEEEWRNVIDGQERRRSARAMELALMAEDHAEMENSEVDPVESPSWIDLFQPQTPFRRKERKIGRNEPCPCGSGKKYKKCCGMN